MKTRVLAAIGEAIGERGLDRPAELAEALAANDRLKYYFSLLQLAAARAENPERPADSLQRDRVAAGVDDPTLDAVVGASERQNDGYSILGCAQLLSRIAQDLRVMAKPVFGRTVPAGHQESFDQRAERLLAALPIPETGCISGPELEEITRVAYPGSDSIHQLVMDLHKALLAMQAELAEESFEGASVYHIDPADRALVGAFMKGLNRTAPLKFDHPGLATTATRSGSTLVIQNDIGETDAHVIVIHVAGLAARVTYSDVHLERLQFLRDQLNSYPVTWETQQTRRMQASASGSEFYLVEGLLDATTPEQLLEYLEFLGSRLVFLIDWNKARKQLRGFLHGKQRTEVLVWAAREEIGQRGFLEAGGARLINDAIDQTAGSAMKFGDRLCDVLGDAAARTFIEFVFRAAMETLRDRQSAGLLHDRIRVELQEHFSSEGKRLLELANEHAGIIFEIASLVRDSIRGISADTDNFASRAARARKFEHEADEIVIASREAVARRPEYSALFRIVEAADDAADELEEVAFLLELLMSSNPAGDTREALAKLADLLVDASQEWIKALAHAIHAGRERATGHRHEASDFLTAIDSLFGLEHQADDVERALIFAAVQHAGDFRQLHLYTQVANSLEDAADSLKSAGLIARDYLLGSVLARGL